MICNCEDCKCWMPEGTDRRDDPPMVGECRRRAPAENGGVRALWPVTMALDWCAEAISKDETKED
jgi:hypothetical protein